MDIFAGQVFGLMEGEILDLNARLGRQLFVGIDLFHHVGREDIEHHLASRSRVSVIVTHVL